MSLTLEFSTTTTGTTHVQEEDIRRAVAAVLPDGEWHIKIIGCAKNDNWTVKVSGPFMIEPWPLYGPDDEHTPRAVADSIKARIEAAQRSARADSGETGE